MKPALLCSARGDRTIARPLRRRAPWLAALAALAGLAVSAAVQASVSIVAVAQSPANNVPPGQAVTYSVTVSSDASGGATDYAVFTILVNNTDVTTQFTPSAPCTSDGLIYCNGNGVTASSTQTYQMTWNTPPPAAGTYQVTFKATCTTSDGTNNPPPCSGGSSTVSTVVSSQPAQTSGTQFQALPGLTANEHTVAVAIDRVCSADTSAQVQALCGTLTSLSPNQQTAALQQITPGQVASQGTNAVVSSYTQLANIRMRLMALRHGPGGFSVGNLSLGIQGQDVPAGRLLAALLKRPNGGGAGADSGTDRLGVFVNGRINFGDRGSTANETGFTFNTQGVTVGMDYRFTDRLVAGGAFGFASTGNEFGSNGGNMDARDLSFSTYGSYYMPLDTFVDWIVTYSVNHYDITHNIAFHGFSTQTNAGADGGQVAVAVNAGKDFHRGGLTFTPYARIEYISTSIDAYRESGGGGLAMVIDNQSLKYLTSVLASRLSKAFSTKWGILTPSVHLEWVHQYENNSRLISGHFVGDPAASFSIQSDSPDRNYFNAGFSLAVTLPRDISGFFTYETVLARNHVHNTLLQLGARVQF